MADEALLQSHCPGLHLIGRGKVRDLYRVDEEHLLFVASDRISAFDVVMATGIPGKGRLLTQLSLFFFKLLAPLGPAHLVTGDIDRMPPSVRAHRGQLEGRSMLVRSVKILPVEAIIRGYLAGSGLNEYQASGTVCGIALPPGLIEGSKLPEPLYTPSTKAPLGQHDLNINPAEAAKLVGHQHAGEIQRRAIAAYTTAAAHAAGRGVIIADTKFEFGLDRQGRVILADEVLTPDSSRFWPADGYTPGQSQPSFDKQFLRDWLLSIGYDKKTPMALPAEVVAGTRDRYLTAYRKLTGDEPKL